mmetsp:Transcript_4204/g.14285  ORF Transcript_4204/g.14285 Transcript_4204/m.14285 type:complete len:129 (-) Transcript_4204:60-446(-)
MVAGVQMLVEQLGLEEDDAREVATGLAQRAEQEAKLQAERAEQEERVRKQTALQCMTDFLRNACADLTLEGARTAAETAAAAGVRTVEKLQRRWRRVERERPGAGVGDVAALLGVDEDDAAAIGARLV